MVGQGVPSLGTWYQGRYAPLRSLDSMFPDMVCANAPIGCWKKQGAGFSRLKSVRGTEKHLLFSRWCCGSGCASFRWCGSEAILHAVGFPIDRQHFCMM